MHIVRTLRVITVGLVALGAFSVVTVGSGGVGAVTINVPADELTIQAAIDAAVDGDAIEVAPGTYFENINFNGKAITLTSTGGPKVTFIDGGNVGTVVTFNTGEGLGSALRNFTIKNGFASFGAGISILGASPTIVGNIFEDNNQSAGGFGAGISGNVSSAVVVGNIFRNNDCDNQHLSGVITFVNSSSPLIANNILEDNTCRAINVNPVAGTEPKILNNTIVGNRVGIRVDRRIDSFFYLFSNNIIVGNGIGLEVDFGTEAFNPTWQNNLVFGNDIDYEIIADQTGINGNISDDPLFADELAGDYRLQIGSPAAEAGDNTVPSLPGQDFLGNPRIIDEDEDGTPVVDIGAFERLVNEPPMADAGLDQTIKTLETTDLDGTGSSDPDGALDGSDLTYKWSINGFEIATGPTPTVGPFPAGVLTIALKVTDANGDNDIDEMVLTVENRPPVANAGPDQTVTDTELVQLDGTGSFDPDPDGTGTFDLEGGALTYEWSLAGVQIATGPNPSVGPFAVGAHVIDLLVTDNLGATAMDSLLVTVNATPPVAVDDVGLLPSGRTVTIAPLSNDQDPFGAGLQINSVETPANGTATLNAGNTVTYRRNTNFKSGCDSYDYTIVDGRGSQATGTIHISVGGFTPCGPPPPNSVPIAVNDNYSMTQGGILAVNAPGVLSNDDDVDGDPLTAQLVSPPSNGVFSFSTDGGFTYTPIASFTGDVNFNYLANDGTDDSNIATVVISVNPPGPGSVHVGDLDGTAIDAPRHKWSASVTVGVHDQNHAPIINALVTGDWLGTSGETNCLTDGTGRCSFMALKINDNKSSVTFTVQNVSSGTASYAPGSNHDPDGDSSSGNAITILQP